MKIGLKMTRNEVDFMPQRNNALLKLAGIRKACADDGQWSRGCFSAYDCALRPLPILEESASSLPQQVLEALFEEQP